VAALGYKEVEFAGYFDQPPKTVRAMLDRHGLTSPSTHIDYASLGDKLPQVIEASQIIGHRFIVNPWLDEEMRKQPDVWKKAAETYNRAGAMTAKAGIQFAYHNHHFEFVPVNGVRPYDFLLETCDPKLVKMELDLCWITVAGQDPLAYFQKYPGRFPMVHVKGITKVPENAAAQSPALPFDQVMPNLTDVGSGDVVDWKRIFAKSSQAGIKHYFVEHDQPKSAFDSLKASAQYLQALRF
jgi:sugar phosphate isomerase/epimerase